AIEDLVETGALAVTDETGQAPPQERVRALEPGDPDREDHERDRQRDGEHGQRRLLERHRGGAYEVRYPRLSVAKQHRVRARSRRSEEHTSQSPDHLVCRLLLEKKNSQAMLAGIEHSHAHNLDHNRHLTTEQYSNAV